MNSKICFFLVRNKVFSYFLCTHEPVYEPLYERLYETLYDDLAERSARRAPLRSIMLFCIVCRFCKLSTICIFANPAYSVYFVNVVKFVNVVAFVFLYF